MKKIIFSALFVLALVMVVTPAFALECKTGNYGSDECWTNVQVSPNETGYVGPGTILVYDITDDSADKAAFNVKISSANTQGNLVAGVAQSRIATGDRANILVRGQGKLKRVGAASTGDRLYVSGTAGTSVKGATADGASVASHDKAIAFALNTASDATADAFIVVI